MTDTSETEVLVIGAGPTGLMLAVWLAGAGVKARILDARAGPTRQTRAVAVQARTLELYGQLGLAGEALRRGRSVSQISLWARGRRAGRAWLGDVGRGLTPYPYIYILTQDHTEALLLARLEALGGRVEWNTRLEGLSQDARGVTARLMGADGGREGVRALYLAGCDGAGSSVRHALGLGFPGGTYAQTFFVADLTASGKAVEGDLNLGLDDHRFLALFPLPGRHRFRAVGLLPPGLPAEQASFEDVRPQVEARGLVRVSELHWFSSYRVHHRVVERFRLGCAFVLGDAAHVHTPVGGQGMNTGLGDAANLAWKLAQVLRGGAADEFPDLLDTFQAERAPFAHRLVNTTDRVFDVVVSPSETARLIRTRVFPLVFPLLTRLRMVRRWLFLTASQTRIRYPASPLSAGRAGRLRGGDRLPWVPYDGVDNFEALRPPHWQLHVYGAPGPELLAWCARRELPLHVFAFTPEARRAGIAGDAAYLIRPDGHVGLAAPHFVQAVFDAYAGSWLPKAPSASLHAGRAAGLLS